MNASELHAFINQQDAEESFDFPLF